MTAIETTSLGELRGQHRGPVITPDDAAYEEARRTFNGMIDRHPEVVTRPLDSDDVVTATSFAVTSGLPIAVRGGGHGVAGHCVGDRSLVVDLRLMRDVTVDNEARTATCGGGALWEDLDPPCQRHGLATPGGTFGDTGVAGLTLTGGIGHLIGLHGLTLDNLVAATVVTADGEVRQSSEHDNPDLFWALRGGGGNFGVVVDFTFRLHPVGRLLGGLLLYAIDDAAAVISSWRDVMATAPDELACFCQIFRSPFDGREGVAVSVAYFGPLEEGQGLVRELTDELTPLRSSVRPMYYAELQEIFGRQPFGLRNYWSGRFLRELADDVIELIAETFRGTDVMGGILLEPFFGAAARVSADATAFAGRGASYDATFIGTWTDPAEDDRWIETARTFSASVAPWVVGGGYLNYASEASPDLETEFGGARLERLRTVKRRFDPENVFRFNHNIVP